MNHIEDSSIVSNYQFPRWSTTLSRSQSNLQSKDTVNDMFQLGIDNRNPFQKSESSTTKRIIHHHVRIPTTSRYISPSPIDQLNSTSDHNTTLDRSTPTSINSRYYHNRSIPIRMKSTALTIPISKSKEEQSFQNFPKQTHEKRKITHERKRKKQQARTLAEKYSDTETWFQLRRSLAELKHLATTQEILVDPSTSIFNCDGHSFSTLKQIIAQQQEDKKVALLKSESGLSSSSFGSALSSRDLNRGSATTSYSSFSRPRTTKRPTQTYPRLIFEPFVIASKPIHTSLITDSNNSTSKPKIKSPVSRSTRSRPNSTIALISDKRRSQLVLSDLSNYDNPPTSLTSSPPLFKSEQDIIPRKFLPSSSSSSIRQRPPSSFQLTSTIKLKPQPPRCRSATDIKSSYSINKNYPRFILIADEEHRIESWYHQYPFILGDDLLTLFESKQLQQKSIISAYFIDDLQLSKGNITAKTFLQGKPFHINNDWKKYDLIFISNNIYQQIIICLQTIINLIQTSGKIIKIYQINHEEDLKRQVKNICKQLQQENI
ncbi:unnamed protein product [Rotaria sordida]|uniref:Uncharacterized protein n=2 Tax=Rotaria sordida TaxID=392033 RepID=A0A813WH18_9BILA|nr:unnamed protein product [Rotaria sordida]CAF0853414.1 unnamed protein product [Rotaria sordida]CAF3645949.1 unnamed protein product [Rotaria sordida]